MLAPRQHIPRPRPLRLQVHQSSLSSLLFLHSSPPNSQAMEQAWPSIWLLIRSWLTPAVHFLLLNFIIAAIVLTSRGLLSHSRHHEPAAGEGHVIACAASSALHRLRSLSLTRLRSGDFFLNPAAAAAAHPKSGEITTASPETEAVEKEDEHLFCRSQSETSLHPAEEGEPSVRMTKSASERSVRGAFEKKKAAEEEEVVEGGVDARADDFINRFRQQLRIQRLNSLKNYMEMLNRGK